MINIFYSFQICLNVTLNKQRKGDLVYMVRDEIWHECRQKVGTKWRTFVLKLEENCPEYTEFHAKLDTVLKVVESPVETKKSEDTFFFFPSFFNLVLHNINCNWAKLETFPEDDLDVAFFFPRCFQMASSSGSLKVSIV